MKRYLFGGVAFAAMIAASGLATAADLSVGPSYKAPPYEEPGYHWTGCYLGPNFGALVRNDGFSSAWGAGALIGGQAGCNYQFYHFVVGLEGDAAWSSLRANAIFGGTDVTSKNDFDGDVAIRMGLAYDHFLFYSKVGATWAHYSFTSTTPGGAQTTGSTSFPGVIWGIGMEYGLFPQWTAKIETDFLFNTTQNVILTCSSGAGCVGVAPVSVPLTTTGVVTKVGLNYKF